MNGAYDMSVAQYSPEGRCYQIEYATKAADRSYTVLGLRGKDAVVMAVDMQANKLYEPDADGRLYSIDRHIGMAVAGLLADANIVAQMARKQASNYLQEYMVPIPAKKMCHFVGSYMHAYTMYGSVRPFGLAITLASWDEEAGPQLFKIEPDGSYYGYNACAIGRNKDNALDEVGDLNLSEMGMNELVMTAGEIIYKVHVEVPNRKLRFEMGIVGQSTDGLHQINPPGLTDMACFAGEAAGIWH